MGRKRLLRAGDRVVLHGPLWETSQGGSAELLNRGLTHFVASDGHDCEFRSPILCDAYALLAEEWGEDRIKPMFVDNPQAVLTGEAVDFEVSRGVARSRKWYQWPFTIARTSRGSRSRH